jgi:hypothetical protein
MLSVKSISNTLRISNVKHTQRVKRTYGLMLNIFHSAMSNIVVTHQGNVNKPLRYLAPQLPKQVHRVMRRVTRSFPVKHVTTADKQWRSRLGRKLPYPHQLGQDVIPIITYSRLWVLVG